jgi:hypothetical protein
VKCRRLHKNGSPGFPAHTAPGISGYRGYGLMSDLADRSGFRNDN